jgi:hypothetical protein
MKKALVIFAASSMLATGVSLASNVSFGQKLAAFLSEVLEFVGPVSGLTHALVKHTDAPKSPLIPNFQDGLSSDLKGLNSGDVVSANLALKGALQARVQARAGRLDDASNYARLNDPQGYANVALTEIPAQLNRFDGGIVARAITEAGESDVLAALGKNLQGKFQDISANGARQDVWASLMSKTDLAPIKLALNVERSNKQEEAGTRIAQALTTQGLTQNAASTAASILSEAAAIQGTGSPTNAGIATASQITPIALAQVTTTTVSGKVPSPGALYLMLIGLVAAAMLKMRQGKILAPKLM